MAAVDDLDEVLEQFHLAQGEFVKGNPEPAKNMCSQREDVTLDNPLSPTAHGWERVAATIERAAAPFRDGEFVSAEIIEKHVTSELAYVVEIERGEAKIGGSEDNFATIHGGPILLSGPLEPVEHICRPSKGTAYGGSAFSSHLPRTCLLRRSQIINHKSFDE
jgi:hypothetical protein